MTENNQSSNACEGCRVDRKALNHLKQFFGFRYFSKKVIYIWMGLPDFREGQVKNWD